MVHIMGSSQRKGADLVIRGRRIRTGADGHPDRAALAVRGDRIVATAAEASGLDALIGPDTTVLDAPGGTVLPAFDDTHTHLIFAALSAHDVPVHRATTIGEVLDLIRERAAVTPPGEWIRTTTNWQELNLAERRFPTAAELDSATDRHPVLLKRGGHNDVLNSTALRMAGITEDTPEPPGGIIERDPSGRLTGRLIDNAMHLAEHLLPAQDPAQRVAGFRRASKDYAATGIGTVRDAAVPLPDLAVLQSALDDGAMSVRVRALVSAMGVTDPDAIEPLLDGMEPWRYHNDPWLRVWGMKFVLDGGLEAAATEEPYLGHDDFCGMLLWERDALAEAVERVVCRGWKVGVHAYGDRAVRVLLDIYAQVLDGNPGVPPTSLVIEHGGLADATQRARAAALGVPVTIQQPLLHDTAEVEIGYWGPERVAQLFPVRQWLDDGALVAAGSDFPVGAFGAMRSVWGMVTRRTTAGVQGAEQAISRAEAIGLHTASAVRLLGEAELRGSLTAGRLADFTVWPHDPMTCDVEALRGMVPTHTVLGGRVVHSP